jgi:glyoxylase-like metal-dependent hydrolase (beta-lactamase superfamily II)
MRGPAGRRLNRRTLLRSAAAGLAGAALGPVATGLRAAGMIEVNPLADSLFVLTGSAGNMLAVTTSEGLVLVDSGAAADRNDLLATLDALSGGGVAVLFNTHWHPGQVGANAALGDRGAAIFAHEKTRQRLTAGYYLPEEDRFESPLPEAGRPTTTFFDGGASSVGGRRIEYGYLIEAHTDGDIFVAMPDLNVIAVGGVVAPQRDPEFDWFGGGWLGGRVDALARLLAVSDADTRFVPGVGPVVGRSEVQREHDMLLELFERIVEHIRLGETPRDMLEAGVLDKLGRDFDDPYRLLYDLQKGFWAHHNKLMHDIV